MPQSDSQPNVIFVVNDDMGWGDLGCYGHPRVETPVLDEFAEEGTLFTQFYANGTVCSPSRAAYLTGDFPGRHGIHQHIADEEIMDRKDIDTMYLDPELPTVSRLLQDAGYATGHIGKWHLGSEAGAPEPEAYGFDEYTTVNSAATGENAFDDEEPWFKARSMDILVDEALEFIRDHREEPFYLNLWTVLPHATLNPFETQLEQYDHEKPSPPAREKFPYNGAMAVYYAALSAIDDGMGRLLDGLENLGLAEDTIVAFTSDHGPETPYARNASHSGMGSTGPLRGRKRSLYEGGVRVPFIVRWPDEVSAGRVDDTVVSGVDWLPTVCELVGVDAPEDVDGESMADVFRGESRDRESLLLWERRFNNFDSPLNRSPTLSIREGTWKLLMNPDRSRVELYNVPADPSEMNDLSEDRPEVRERLAERLLNWKDGLPESKTQVGAGTGDYPWPDEEYFNYQGRNEVVDPSERWDDPV